jgi:hypothetical protein
MVKTVDYYSVGRYLGTDGNAYEWDGPPYEHFMRTGPYKHDRIIAPVELADIPNAMNELDNLVASQKESDTFVTDVNLALENDKLRSAVLEAVDAVSDMISYAEELARELGTCLQVIIDDLNRSVSVKDEYEPERCWDRSCL